MTSNLISSYTLLSVVVVILTFVLAPCGCSSGGGSQPHIVLIVADDLGWNDVGWKDPGMYTPVLDSLARGGVILNQTYMQAECSPSRAALLTGLYPFRLGLQHNVIGAGKAEYLTDQVSILPQYLKQFGYSTHLIGKWHMGFCDWKYTPTYRGFDSFYGFYNAVQGYYSHTGKKNGYDFRDNESVDWSAKGKYSTHLFAARAQRIIRNHNSSQPMFMFLSFQAAHGPLEVPKHYVDRYCASVPDRTRRVHCAMVAAMDEAIGNVTRTLRESGLLDNTLVVFTTDNGGATKQGSSNWPLRGSKKTLWEGGTRAISFVYSTSTSLLPNRGETFNGLMHVADWFPTILAVAEGTADTGLSPALPQNIDGINMWNDIRRAARRSNRHEMVYNIDEIKNNSAIRVGRWKLIEGKVGRPQGWYYPPEGTVAPEEPRGRQDDLHLYDLQRDPLETRNIASSRGRLVQRLMRKLDNYKRQLVPSMRHPVIRSSNPRFFNNTWSPGFCRENTANAVIMTTATAAVTTTTTTTTAEDCPV